jgi:glycine/D-amino acid oxidase-like deaminating enzyme
MGTRVAVLGAGLQGACVALELALAGVEVDLYDRCDEPLTRTSVRNEGKLHLGFVYANDPTLATARTMVAGATAFAPLLRRWIGDSVDEIPVSSPFLYAVHRESLLDAGEITRHLEQCRELIVEACDGSAPDYFGSDCRTACVRLTDRELNAALDGSNVTAAFRTPEIGIDSRVLAELLRARLVGHERIDFRPRTRVDAVEPGADSVTVESENGGARGRRTYDHAVNALWEGRLAVDQTAGIAPERRRLYRLKYYTRVDAPDSAAGLPSVTVVLGPFGDVVAYGNGAVYLSWYPVGMRATSAEVAPPAWPLDPPEPLRTELQAATHDGLVGIVPALARLADEPPDAYEVSAGVIVARGETDIDDAGSELHERHAIGPVSRGRYHTVDTGKLTTAPLFGKTVADRILDAS